MLERIIPAVFWTAAPEPLIPHHEHISSLLKARGNPKSLTQLGLCIGRIFIQNTDKVADRYTYRGYLAGI